MIVTLVLLALSPAADPLSRYSLPPVPVALSACNDTGCGSADATRTYRVDADPQAGPTAKDRAMSAQGVNCGMSDRRCPKRTRRILTLGLPE